IYAPQIVKAAAGYSHVLAPSTTTGKDLMPRVAALLGVGQVSDIMSVEGPRAFTRPIYAGNAIVNVEVKADDIVVGTVRTASWAAAKSSDNSAPVESLDLDVELPSHT